jgi:hypothetical protein
MKLVSLLVEEMRGACCFSNDAARLVSGKPLGEEYTLALAVQFVLEHGGKRGPVCKNLSSSRCVLTDSTRVAIACASAVTC